MPKFKSKKHKRKSKPVEENAQLSGIREKLQWLDPFHYVDLYVMPKVKEQTDSKWVEGLVNLVFAALFAAVIYFCLGIVFGSNTPLVIVYSESMEPDFYRGDVMALAGASANTVNVQEITLNRNLSGIPSNVYATPNYKSKKLVSIEFENGEIIYPSKEGSVIVYASYPQGLPIIHRTIVKINAIDGTFFLTKGDNGETNPTFDQDCGSILLNNPEKNCITFYAVNAENIQGQSFLKVPIVGCVKLWLVDDFLSIVTTGKLSSNFNGIC